MTDTMPPGGGPPDPDQPEAADAGGQGEAPDPQRLDEVGERIGRARATAEETIGTADEEPLYTESGEEEPSDDQTITPPG